METPFFGTPSETTSYSFSENEEGEVNVKEKIILFNPTMSIKFLLKLVLEYLDYLWFL